MLPADVTPTPATEPDFAMLRELAGSIWRQHCAEIISAAQIDYNASAGGLNFTGDYLANSSFVTVTAVPETCEPG